MFNPWPESSTLLLLAASARIDSPNVNLHSWWSDWIWSPIQKHCSRSTHRGDVICYKHRLRSCSPFHHTHSPTSGREWSPLRSITLNAADSLTFPACTSISSWRPASNLEAVDRSPRSTQKIRSCSLCHDINEPPTLYSKANSSPLAANHQQTIMPDHWVG